MLFESVIKKYRLFSIVKDVFLLESQQGGAEKVRLGFFADGFPGIVWLQTNSPALMLPKGKSLTSFFIYGQTLLPLELEITGSYQMLVFQLQPFAVRAYFGVNPKLLNDDCFDLSIPFEDTLQLLQNANNVDAHADILAKFIARKAESAANEKSSQIQIAVGLVLSSGGKISVKSMAQQLYMTERTLQRLFMEYVGVSPKQFAKIVQFQQSFSQLSDETFDKLTEIVFENGYADQSHFIRNFRRFTGRKPSDFR